MMLFCEVADGGLIPGKHLGMYRRNYDRATSYFMLMPLNVPARWAYNAWMWCRFAFSPDVASETFERGYDKGSYDRSQWSRDEEKEAYVRGVHDGERDAHRQLREYAASYLSGQ